MFKFDLINKLAISLLNKKNEKNISFLLIVIRITAVLSFFYLIGTELNDFILYLSFCSLAFFTSFWLCKFILDEYDFYFIKIIFGKRNSSFNNEFVENIISSNFALLLATIVFLNLLKKVNPFINVEIITNLLLLIYSLTIIIFLILMNRVSLKRSLILFLTNMGEVRKSLEPNKYRENNFQVNEKITKQSPIQIYENNKEIFQISYNIKLTFWSLLSIFMILFAMGNINGVIYNITSYPSFEMPGFELEIKSIFRYLMAYLAILIGWGSLIISTNWTIDALIFEY